MTRSCPFRPPDVIRASTDYKRHLPASDQADRNVGKIFHEEASSIVTRCGQVHLRLALSGYKPQRVTGDFTQATCRSCLKSFAAEVMGVVQSTAKDEVILELRIAHHHDWSIRIVDGPPIEEFDIEIFYARDRELMRLAQKANRQP